MNKQNSIIKNHLTRMGILLFLICIGMASYSPKIIQAKNHYSSAKQVKQEIKKINKKLPKASKEYKKANSQYKALYNRDKSETAGSRLMLMAKIVNSNPFIVRYGKSYYHVLNPSNGITLLGSYTASFRVAGGTFTFANQSCVNVTAVKSSVDAKLTSARKNLQKKQKTYLSLSQKKNRLKKTLTYRVPRKNCSVDAGEAFSLEYFCEDSYYNKVTWKSSDPSLLTIKNGKVKALRPGKVTITAKTSISKKTTKIAVIIKNFKKLPLEHSHMTIAVGRKKELWVTNENLYFIEKAYSSNSNVVSVKNGGNYITLKAEGVGTAVITAIGENNEMGTCTVEVFEPTFKTDQTSQPLVINTESFPVTYTVSFQSNLSKSDIQWPSGDRNSEVTVNYDKTTSDSSLVNGTLTFTFNDLEYDSGYGSYSYHISYNYDTICSLDFVIQNPSATSANPTEPPLDSDWDD